MDWEFEVAKSDDLYNLIADGLAETTDCKDWLTRATAKGPDGQFDLTAKSSFGDVAQSNFGDGWDSGGGPFDPSDPTYPPDTGGGGGPGEETDPGPPPPTSFDPDNPVGPLFDYSTLFDVSMFTSWVEAISGFADYERGSWHDYDSLEQFMNGEWLFDLDPELNDSFSYNQGFSNPYIEYGQYTPVNHVGIPGGGGLVPIFSEWTEVRNLGIPGDGNLSFEIIHHTTFLGLQRAQTYQVASLDDPFGFLGRVTSGALDSLSLVSAWENFAQAMSGAPDTRAMGTPRIGMNGMLMAPVSLDGHFIGHVSVNDHGMQLFDANGNRIPSPTLLTQDWNQLDGVVYQQRMAHQERTTGVPFATSIVTFASTAAGGLLNMSFWRDLGFGFASDVLSGANAASSTAYARLLEAAFELREYELRNR